MEWYRGRFSVSPAETGDKTASASLLHTRLHQNTPGYTKTKQGNREKHETGDGSLFPLPLTLFLLIEGFLYMERSLRPAILSAVELHADVLATEAINRAVIDRVSEEYVYGKLISIERDEAGCITMAGVNTGEANRLMAETTLATQEALMALDTETFALPLGEVWDNYLVATYGPDIPVRLHPPRGRVSTSLQDGFEVPPVPGK